MDNDFKIQIQTLVILKKQKNKQTPPPPLPASPRNCPRRRRVTGGAEASVRESIRCPLTASPSPTSRSASTSEDLCRRPEDHVVAIDQGLHAAARRPPHLPIEDSAMNVDAKQAISAAKLEKEVDPEHTRDEKEILEDPDTSAEAMASAAKLEKEARDKLPCLEQSAVKAEAMGAANLEKEVTLPEHTMDKLAFPEESAVKVEVMGAANVPLLDSMEKGHRLKGIDDLAALKDKVEALYIDKQLLKTSLNKADEKVMELSNGMQALHSDHKILQINLNKAEEEVVLLSNQNRALEELNEKLFSLLEREQKHRSERKDPASNTIKNRDSIVGHGSGDHLAVDILELGMGKEKEHDQLSSEGEEPTELDPRDKGLFNFLKAVSNVACTAINAFNIGFCVLAYNSSGRHATNEVQKLILVVGGVGFMPASIITAGHVHSLEGKANDIDLATGYVFGEISYAFFAICLVAMFVAKAPWFVVVPLFLLIWPVTINWLVLRYRRPRGLYRRLRSVKKRFKYKAQID